jgi:hypothetical protein
MSNLGVMGKIDAEVRATPPIDEWMNGSTWDE